MPERLEIDDPEGDREGWGPWEAHDGLGCPLPSGTETRVLVEQGDGSDAILNLVTRGDGLSWHWEKCGWEEDGSHCCPIRAYRLRKGQGMAMLKWILESIPDKKVKEPEDA